MDSFFADVCHCHDDERLDQFSTDQSLRPFHLRPIRFRQTKWLHQKHSARRANIKPGNVLARNGGNLAANKPARRAGFPRPWTKKRDVV